MDKYTNPFRSTDDLSIIDYLNKNIWVRLSNSRFGVGVIAIRHIPKGTIITDYDYDYQSNRFSSIKSFFVNYDTFLKSMPILDIGIRELMNDRYIFPEKGLGQLISPNCHQLIRMYVNHSDNPNIDLDLVTTRDIFPKEEICFSYKDIISQDVHDISKKHYEHILMI